MKTMRFCVLIGMLAVAPAAATSLPGMGDAFCAPVGAGPTVCHVLEGNGDSLVELVVNATGLNILINSVLPGPIVYLSGDVTDIITSDPIISDSCTGLLLPVGGTCTFTQAFTTGTPGDPDDGAFLLDDGESAMYFALTFTPEVSAGVFCNNGQVTCVAPPGTVVNPDGSFTAVIESADVFVTDTPEPVTLALTGFALIGLGVLRRRQGRS